jgi:D-alanyl-D-alanine carboxypeptidase/D-alanyl-D-alanine-endopeptidase (penicillin-binding protein 4)
MRKTSAFKNVHAKTGTLSGVSCISGFVETKNNHQIAFSIMMQNFVGSSKLARDLQDVICEILSQQK